MEEIGKSATDTVTVSKAVYAELLYDTRMLAVLDMFGVTDWEGFSEAYSEFLENYPEYDID